MHDSSTATTEVGRHCHPTRTTLDGAIDYLDWQDANGLRHYEPRHLDNTLAGWARNDERRQGVTA